jgi:hypothetical protein
MNIVIKQLSSFLLLLSILFLTNPFVMHSRNQSPIITHRTLLYMPLAPDIYLINSMRFPPIVPSSFLKVLIWKLQYHILLASIVGSITLQCLSLWRILVRRNLYRKRAVSHCKRGLSHEHEGVIYSHLQKLDLPEHIHFQSTESHTVVRTFRLFCHCSPSVTIS